MSLFSPANDLLLLVFWNTFKYISYSFFWNTSCSLGVRDLSAAGHSRILPKWFFFCSEALEASAGKRLPKPSFSSKNPVCLGHFFFWKPILGCKRVMQSPIMRSHINQPGQECWAFSESIWWCEESSSQPTGQIWSRWSNSRGIVKYLEYIAWCCTSFNQPTTPCLSPRKYHFQRKKKSSH